VTSLQIIKQAVEETLKEIKECPSGHLYAMLMTYNIGLEEYQSIIAELKEEGKIKESHYLLTWIE